MSTKRKAASTLLERRVRPRREDAWEAESEQSLDSSENTDNDEVSDQDTQDSGDQSGSESSGEDSEDESKPPKVDAASISFGALARAQASLAPQDRKSKKGGPPSGPLDEDPPQEHASRYHKKDMSKPKRSSKHAPQEVSSKHPVTRRREVVSTTIKRTPARDPRFDPLSGGRMDESKARKAYAFLDEYRDKELAELKVQLKKTKDTFQREDLKRQILSMESRKKARQKKDEEEQVLLEHKQKEKELVAQGKKPFYLKKSDQKKQLLMNRYAGMSKGQVDKAIERKRKKVAGREKKELGHIERVTSRRNR